MRSKDALEGKRRSYQVVAEAAGIPNSDAIAVLNAIMNLAAQRERYHLSQDQLLDDLSAAVPDSANLRDEQARSAVLGRVHKISTSY
jgi:hypothetical protein